ncbi:MAG: hypothetical protein KatS3mg030_179 [Saprospiraceae bacterium]|nr:MAG: hypothetical protein KatS3mg030_179 [Saprospiraceae bacterium]
MEEKPGKNPERVPGFSTQNTMLFLLKNRGNTAKKELTIGFGIDVDEAVVSTGLTPVAKSNGCLSIHSRRRANSPSIFFFGEMFTGWVLHSTSTASKGFGTNRIFGKMSSQEEPMPSSSSCIF